MKKVESIKQLIEELKLDKNAFLKYSIGIALQKSRLNNGFTKITTACQRCF
jgi:hypothetical protein